MGSDHNYWFPAKRYGWGWSFPTTWQGWLVFALYFVAIGAGFFLCPPAKATVEFVVYVATATAAMIAVCWLKGEPPRWRWGDD